MMNSISCSVFCGFVLSVSVLEFQSVTAKTQFLYDRDEGLPSKSSSAPNYRLSTPKFKEPSNKVPQHLQDIQFVKGPAGDVIHIIDPPSLTTNKKHPTSPQQRLKPIPKDLAIKFQNAIVDDGNLQQNSNRPQAAFLIKPQAANQQQEFKHHNSNSNQLKKSPPKFGPNPGFINSPESHGYHFGNPQFYPLKISAAVRHNHIVRHRPTPLIPKVKHRVQFKKFKTFQSEIQKKSYEFDEEAQKTQVDSIHTNVSSPVKYRPRRSTNPRRKSRKTKMHGSLLPVALTIMGENGELSTGRALLQHITFLLKNASDFESYDDEVHDEPTFDHKYVSSKDVILNEKDFHRIMDNSMNLTDPMMLTALAANEYNTSSLLTNTYVNEYLNCIDSSKTLNRFKALQNKIDCMKRKMFDRSNFDNADSSRYSISDLPAALVYADVMTNIKNLIRPKKGIAFYTVPVDELSHLQKVVLSTDEYSLPPPEEDQSSQIIPSSYQNRQIFFNENIHQPRMPVWYVVKSDGRIYQMEQGPRSSRYNNPVFHGLYSDPIADGFFDGPPSRLPNFDSVYYDDKF